MAGEAWPVEVVGYGSLLGRTVPPGEPTFATRVFDPEAGEPIGYVLNCPKCGELGHVELGPDGWTAAIDSDGGLTLRPSVLCRCGAHYWLTDGVLKEA